MGQFDTQVFDITLTESILVSIFRCSYIIIAIVVFTLHQGFNVGFDWKFTFVAIIIFILFNINSLIQFYLNGKYDVLVPLFDNYSNQVSLRNVLISKLFDVNLWLLWVAYDVFTYPNVMHLTSKIRINWMAPQNVT